jgi:hypothetical protein
MEQHRETGAGPAVPRIVAPSASLDPGDSLRWTGVAEADLYRVRVWDGEGTVVWTTDTRDTTAALPAQLRPGVQYMWDVSARTGWDRWVSSDIVELTLRTP